MRALMLTIAALLVLPGCTENDASDCEMARAMVVATEISLCGTPEYAGSKFCLRCVKAHYYSTTGASVCQCAPLTFDVSACSYATGDDATSRVRSAIDWADSVCADFTPPAAIPPMSEAGPPVSTPDGSDSDAMDRSDDGLVEAGE